MKSLRELKHVEKAWGNRILQEKTQRRCRQRRQRDSFREEWETTKQQKKQKKKHTFLCSPFRVMQLDVHAILKWEHVRNGKSLSAHIYFQNWNIVYRYISASRSYNKILNCKHSSILLHRTPSTSCKSFSLIPKHLFSPLVLCGWGNLWPLPLLQLPCRRTLPHTHTAHKRTSGRSFTASFSVPTDPEAAACPSLHTAGWMLSSCVPPHCRHPSKSK